MIFFQFTNYNIISSSNNERYIYFKVTTEVLNEICYSSVDYYMNWKLFLNETIETNIQKLFLIICLEMCWQFTITYLSEQWQRY